MVVVWVALAPAESRAGDRLNAARQEAGASSSSSSSGGGGGWSWDDDDDDCDCDDDGPGLLGLLLGAAASNEESDGDASIVDEKRGFLPYPYADGRPGYMVRAEPGDEVSEDTHHAVFRFGTEGGYLYEDVWRSSTQFRFMLPRFYGQLRFDHFLEGPTPRLDGDLEVRGTVRDRLNFLNLELGPQFSAGEHLAVRFGVLGNLMFDDRRSLPEDITMTHGVGGVLEFDVYPVRPVVFSGRGVVQKLGKTVMFEGRATAGVMLNRFEIYAGYDHRQIGDVHLGGPTAGVSVRF